MGEMEDKLMPTTKKRLTRSKCKRINLSQCSSMKVNRH